MIKNRNGNLDGDEVDEVLLEGFVVGSFVTDFSFLSFFFFFKESECKFPKTEVSNSGFVRVCGISVSLLYVVLEV